MKGMSQILSVPCVHRYRINRHPFSSTYSGNGASLPLPLDLPPPPHVATCGNSGDVAHVRGGESLTCKVGDPIMELIVTRHDEAALLAVQGVSDQKCCPTAVTLGWQVWWLNDVVQE